MTVALRSLPKVVNFKLRRGKIRIETVTRANVLNHFTKPKIKCFGEFLKSMLLLGNKHQLPYLETFICSLYHDKVECLI